MSPLCALLTMRGEGEEDKEMGRRVFTCGMLAALVFVFVFSIAVRQTEAEIFEKKRYRVYKEKYARGEILVKFKADAAMGGEKKTSP